MARMPRTTKKQHGHVAGARRREQPLTFCDDCKGPLCPFCGEHLGLCPECLGEFICDGCGWTAAVESWGMRVVDTRTGDPAMN